MTTHHKLRAVVLCPGRGSYGRAQLGSLANTTTSPALDAFEAVRASHGRPSLRSLDAAPRYSAAKHVAGEHASLLTAACTLTDIERLDPDKVDVVCITGNSMGWYTALGAAGALDLHSCGRLIDTMGGYQAGRVVGGQLVVPLTGDDWRPDPNRLARVDAVVDAVPDLYWSIRLGGQAVLGGSAPALAAAVERLPKETRGAHSYPLKLPLHSAFHTPLLRGTAGTARTDLADLPWRAPTIPLIDGTGRSWRPLHTHTGELSAWTLGAQITDTFDFTAMITAALGEYGPDVVVLPGPGEGLGGAVAQVMVSLGWRGLRDRNDFRDAQRSDTPVLLSLCRPDQAARVCLP